MKTILQVLDRDLTGEGHDTDRNELIEYMESECRAVGDTLGAGEWLASSFPFLPDEKVESTVCRLIALWASADAVSVVPETYVDLATATHEFVPEDLALATVSVCTRLRESGRALPGDIGDLVFRLSGALGRLFELSGKNPSQLLTACVAKYERAVTDLHHAAEGFKAASCVSAKQLGIELLKKASRFRQMALAAERPILSDLEALLGPSFRGFSQCCQHHNATEAAQYSPLVREQAASALRNAGPKQFSTLWHSTVALVAEHVVSLVDEESKRSAESTAPDLSITNSVVKLDLSRANREMQFSFRLANQGKGLARGVRVEPEIAQLPIDLRLLKPNQEFDVGGESEQIVSMALTLRHPVAGLLLPLIWRCRTIRGQPYEHRNLLTIQQQSTHPDWGRLRLNPPYAINPVRSRDRLFGRDAVLNRLTVYAAGGSSCFIWGAKRVGKTSVAQVLREELRKDSSFIVTFLRMGELGAYHEGQMAHLMAARLTSQLADVQVPVPPEGEFGAGLSRLIPFVEELVSSSPVSKFVIIVDEFDDLDESLYTGERGKRFVGALRSLSEIGLTFFFVGSERMDPIYHAHATALNKWVSVHLDTIESREDSKTLILRPVDGMIEYQSECVDRIIDYCGSNPYFMHLVCAEVFQTCVNEERTFVSASDLETVLESQRRKLDEANFAHFWADNPELVASVKHQQTAENCLVLTCMANCPGQVGDHRAVYDRQETLGLGPSHRLGEAAVARALERLRSRGVVAKDGHETYRLTLPIFRDWLSGHAELRLLPVWRDYCVRRDEAAGTEAVAPIRVESQESSLPIREDDITAVSTKLIYNGKQKSEQLIRSWLRQFDDDNRIRIAFRLLQRLTDRGYVTEGARRRLIGVLEEAIVAERTATGVPWRVVGKRGTKDNLCISYLDSGSEMKSGATLARDLVNSLRPTKYGAPNSLGPWMRAHVDQSPMLLLVDEFAGSGKQAVDGVRGFLSQSDDKALVDKYLSEGYVYVCLLSVFSEAQERLRTEFPELSVITAHVFGDDVRALEKRAQIFEDESEYRVGQDMLYQLGVELYPQAPFGWGEIGALVCFATTIPNNTLPIFWCNGEVGGRRWVPILERR